MIVGYRAAPSLMVILVTLLINLPEVLVIDFSEITIRDGVYLITALPGL